MAFRLDCDVADCRTSEPLATHATAAPAGWCVIEVYDQPAQSPNLYGLLAAATGQARGRSYYVCPNHALPTFRDAPKAEAAKAPDWVSEVIGSLTEGAK